MSKVPLAHPLSRDDSLSERYLVYCRGYCRGRGEEVALSPQPPRPGLKYINPWPYGIWCFIRRYIYICIQILCGHDGEVAG